MTRSHLLALAGLLAVATLPVDGQNESLQQSLNAQFTLSTAAADRSDITSAGTPVVLKKGGLIVYATASPLPPLSTYKNGKFSQGFGARILRESIAQGAVGDTSTYPSRTLAVGTRLWVTAMKVQKDGILFDLYTDPYNDGRYYGQVKLAFQKHSSPSPEEGLSLVSEVLVPQITQTTSPEARKNKVRINDPPADAGHRPMSDLPGVPTALQLPATYASTQSPTDQLRLQADHTFSLQVAGQSYGGSFTADENTVVLDILPDHTKSPVAIQGDHLTDANGQTWTLQANSSNAAASVEVLRNADILALVSAGVPETEILAKIANSKCQFDISADAIVMLSRAGATPSVLKAVRTAAK